MEGLNDFSLNVITALINFYNSDIFAVIKFLIGIYTVVLFVDVVLLLIQRGLSANIKEANLGMNIPRELVRKKSKDKLRRNWEKVKEKAETREQVQIKVAIIEADDLINDLIRRMAFPGVDTTERLAGINSGQIENIEDLKKAHSVRNRIVHDEKFIITKEQADETMSAYENFLKYHEVLD